MDILEDIDFDQELIEEGGQPIDLTQEGRSDLVNLQMVMVSSSMNHEYVRKAYERCKSYHKQQELLARMSQLKTLYYVARTKLAEAHPDRLEAIEVELSQQKQTVLSDHNLH
jgi:hypothetical protein